MHDGCGTSCEQRIKLLGNLSLLEENKVQIVDTDKLRCPGMEDPRSDICYNICYGTQGFVSKTSLSPPCDHFSFCEDPGLGADRGIKANLKKAISE